MIFKQAAPCIMYQEDQTIIFVPWVPGGRRCVFRSPRVPCIYYGRGCYMRTSRKDTSLSMCKHPVHHRISRAYRFCSGHKNNSREVEELVSSDKWVRYGSRWYLFRTGVVARFPQKYGVDQTKFCAAPISSHGLETAAVLHGTIIYSLHPASKDPISHLLEFLG